MYKQYFKPGLKIINYLLKDNLKKIPSKKITLDALSETMLSQLNQRGFAILNNFISKQECEILIKKIDYVINNYPDKVWQDSKKSDIRIFGAELIDQKIMDYFKSVFIQRIGEKYCGFKIKNLMTMANRVEYKNENYGSGAGWHKDAYRKQFKSMIYLNKVNNNNGPFQLIKNSNSFFHMLKVATILKKSYPNTRFDDGEIKKIYKNQDIKTLTAESGSLILFDPCLTHRGAPLLESKRYAITNYYESLHNFDGQANKYEPRFTND